MYLIGDILSSNPLLNLQADRSYPEYFQYQKLVWIAVSLIYYASTRKKGCILLLSAIPVYLLVDDYQFLHEQIGTSVAVNILGSSDASVAILQNTNFRTQDVGELLYMAAMGLFIYAVAMISYLIAKEKGDKRYVIATVLMVTTFGLFAVFVDGVHQLFDQAAIYDLLGRIEDFGEMVAVSAWCALAYRYTCDPKKSRRG